jgi:hypothetical protein
MTGACIRSGGSRSWRRDRRDARFHWWTSIVSSAISIECRSTPLGTTWLLFPTPKLTNHPGLPPSSFALENEGEGYGAVLDWLAFSVKVRDFMSVGYSKRSLVEKLGIKPGTRVIALGAPAGYSSLLGRLPPGATLHARLPVTSAFIHRFVRHRDELVKEFPRLAKVLKDDGMLWISWPKTAAGVDTDLQENIVREIGLAHGLVDVKVCAVDEIWSGLKFVRRVANRGR